MSPRFPIKTARPFLKWAGGKSQLLAQMDPYFPGELKQGKVERYIEPFTGGGAVFFYIAQVYPVQEYILADVNPELTLVYQCVQQDAPALIERLACIQADYLALEPADRESYYYAVRQLFNQCTSAYALPPQARLERAAQIIFLNRTCYNGLFRVNSKGKFNAPYGRYKSPRICDSANLLAASRILQKAHILTGGFSSVEPYVDENSFVYFDPPYRPLSKTANFTAYAQHTFSDADQLLLADFYRRLHQKGAQLMLSNSDPKNEEPQDNFFESAYAGFQIKRVSATRLINRDASKRGRLAELLILNYETTR